MTLYGWDSSHYDGHLTVSILQRAATEGITFWTHKIGEGLTNTDPYAQEAFTNAKGIFPVIGGYYFLHADEDIITQADRCISLANTVVPYWKTLDEWFWQTDAESETGHGMPSAAQVKQFSDRLAQQTGKAVIVYASAGMYGDRLTGLGHPLWNAHYGTNPTGPFKSIYPGDSSAGWNSYSGQIPALLQYGSKATIAGLTTCDANAFRGTLNDLLALIGAPTMDEKSISLQIRKDLGNGADPINAAIVQMLFNSSASDIIPMGDQPSGVTDPALCSAPKHDWYQVRAAVQLGTGDPTTLKHRLDAQDTAIAQQGQMLQQIIALLQQSGGSAPAADTITQKEQAEAYRAAADALDPPEATP